MDDPLSPEDADFKPGEFIEEIVVFPIEETLDLHTFRASEVKDLLNDYLEAAYEKGFREVLIIHGKGTGVLRQRVHSILEKHQLVLGFCQADESRGGWGATVVHLRKRHEEAQPNGATP